MVNVVPLTHIFPCLTKAYVSSASVNVNCSGWVEMVDEWMNVTAAIANGMLGVVFPSFICFHSIVLFSLKSESCFACDLVAQKEHQSL